MCLLLFWTGWARFVLRSLNLDTNLLSGAIPTTFSGLTAATLLSMKGNALNSSVPSALSALAQLRSECADDHCVFMFAQDR